MFNNLWKNSEYFARGEVGDGEAEGGGVENTGEGGVEERRRAREVV